MKAELLIQSYVLGTVREGEQPDLSGAPGVELVHGRGEQCLADAAVLQRWIDRDRPEEADASPSGREIGAYQPTTARCTERRNMGRAPAAINVVSITPESFRFGDAERCRTPHERCVRPPVDHARRV